MNKLLLIPLLISLGSCSFNKYPSKTQAKLACDEWVSEGGFYDLKINEFKREFEDIRLEEIIKEDDSKLRPDIKSVQDLFNSAREFREVKTLKIRNYPEQTIEERRRYCIEEKETKQFLGYEFKVSKGKVITIQDCDPPYGQDTNRCFSDSTIKEKTLKKNFYF